MTRSLPILYLWVAATCFSAEPETNLQAEGHPGTILFAEFTPDATTLITSADDGFIRFWDMTDSSHPQLADVMKIQSGKPDHGGTLFACDISPDGRWLAVAGVMDRFYVIDIQRRKIVGMGQDDFQRIGDVEFSPDGRYLAMCDLNFVDVWPVSKLIASNSQTGSSRVNKLGPRDRHGYRYSCVGVSWKQNGNDLQLLVSGWKAAKYFRVPASFGALIPSSSFPRNGRGRLTDRNVRNTLVTPNGRWVVTLSRGFKDRYFNSLAVWTTSGEFVRELNPAGLPLEEPICINHDGTGVACVTRTSAGSQLIEYGLTEPTQTIIPMDAAPLSYSRGNRFLLGRSGAQASEMHCWDRKTNQQSTVKARSGEIYAVRISEDGNKIGWSWSASERANPIDGVFDLEAFRVTTHPRGKSPTTWKQKTTQAGTYSVKPYRLETGLDATTIDSGGREVIQRTGDTYFQAAEILPNGYQAVLGGVDLVKYDLRGGRPIQSFKGFRHFFGRLRDIAISKDGRTMLTCHHDQILRLWDLTSSASEVKPMLSLFVTNDGKDFVAWTREGYYTGTPAGHKFLLWSEPVGPHQFYQTVWGQQYRKLLYRPDVVELIPIARTTQRAITLAATYQNARAEPMVSIARDQSKLAVPEVRVSSPQPSAIVQDDIVTVKGSFRSKGSLPIMELRLTVNKRPVVIHECLDIVKQAGKNSTSQPVSFSLDVPLLPNGPNVIEVSAATQGAISQPVSVEVISEIKSATKPNLYLLGIGVADYEQQDMQLSFPDEDVSSVAAALKIQKGRFYEDVIVEKLINEEVTERNIRRALKQLTQNVTQHDVAIIMISGHGHADDTGEFYFCPHDFELEEAEITGVPWEDLTEPLTKMPCKVLLCIDTCYSAGVLEKPAEGLRGKSTARRRRSAFETALNQLRSVDPALVVLTSSTDQQESFEKDEWGHGAFALSLVEVLTGKHKVEGSRIALPADINNDRFLEISEIDSYVTARVRELTNGRQQPVTDRGRAPSFPIGVAQ